MRKTYVDRLAEAGADTTKLQKTLAVLVVIIAVLMSLFHLYRAQVGVLEAWRQRSLHVFFTLALAYMVSVARVYEKKRNPVLGWLGLVLTLAIAVYTQVDYYGIIGREGAPNLYDRIAGTLLMVLLVWATKEHVSSVIACLAGIFFLYGMYGWMLPGRFASPRFTYGKIIDQMFNSTGGMFGVSTSVSAIDVIMFVIFGAFLERSGAADFFNDLAIKLAGKTRGGPAKAAVVASALVGTLEGSSVANVATTGSVTIPLMKEMGFDPVYAGAVEAAASTGGMIMPPVMGAAAFILAEMTKTPYSKIMVHAVIPACLYFLGIFITIDLQASRKRIRPLAETTDKGEHLDLWMAATCILPLVVIIVALLIGYSPMRSAFFAIAILTVLWALRPSNRLTFRDLMAALERGATTMIPVALACASAGIIVGFIGLTGIGVKLSAMVSIWGTHQIVALILAMLVSIVLGMGVPVASAYILSVSTVGGMLIRTGVPMFQAHLFLLYFATISAITPPVALGAYAAAGIAGADPNRTGWQACKLALSGFIVPYMFVHGPALLCMGTPAQIIQAAATAVFGVFCLSITVEGWFRGQVSLIERALLMVAALGLLHAGGFTDLIGIVIGGAVLIRRLRMPVPTTE
ncbi:MAG: TRAP transporter fused permease subunit [Firmicutes bacterium]|nr:TRAP transporter fused permease subunit [Candidatus Fermentithermobacillaceae bacterium]